jgi:molybdenum cofactor cytidylyltransferase
MEQALDNEAEKLILQPTCAGVPGHPVGFSASFIEELGLLRGDEGARRVLQAHPASVRRLEVADPGVLRDLDQPDQIPAD